MLCALGGIIGLLWPGASQRLITTLASITMTITIGYILLALIVSTVIGMIAGIYPAFKAASTGSDSGLRSSHCNE